MDTGLIPFGILMTGDEETGGDLGAGFALSRIKTDFCIALDGGNPDKIVIKEKGPCKIKLTAHGKSAHGARPWLGENAIEILMDDLTHLKALFSEKSKDHWHKTLNIGIIKAGTAHNQVPDRAEAISINRIVVIIL